MSHVTPTPLCRVCGNAQRNTPYTAKEMMFGSREEFQYFQCANCQCLQIVEFPEDIGRHYPSNYYSMSMRVPPDRTRGVKNQLRMTRNRSRITGRGFLGGVLNAIYPLTQTDCPAYIFRLRLPFTSRILDVGCGTGALTCELRNLGYRHVTGVDPFIAERIEYGNGVVVHKMDFAQMNPEYDLVVFHHTYEHLPTPHETLAAAHRLLSAEGICLLVIPTVSSYAWEHYGTDWVQLDAPRHFFLHSHRSIALLAAGAGFEVADIVCDSNEAQFWGSEQYRLGIPLTAERSYAKAPAKSAFSEAEIMAWRARAAVLNSQGRGDQIQVVLRKSAQGGAE